MPAKESVYVNSLICKFAVVIAVEKSSAIAVFCSLMISEVKENQIENIFLL